MVQSSQMTRLFVLLAIFSLFSLADTRIIKYVKRCPTRIERHFINQYSDCKQPDMFHCTYDDHFDLVETCNTYIQLPPGNYPRYNSFSDRITYEECPKNKYQPWPVKSYEIAECEVAKSSCNGAGQIPCDSGTSTTDDTCRCDFTQGFVPVGQFRCCSPSENEDCFCQYRPCENEMQELNSDYVCVPKCQTGYIRLPGQMDCTLAPTTDVMINTTTTYSTSPTDAAMGIVNVASVDKTAILVAIGIGFFLCFVFLMAIWYYGEICRPYKMQLSPFVTFLAVLIICFLIAVITISRNNYDVHAKYLVTVLMICIVIGTSYCAYLLNTFDLKKDRITYNEEYEVKIYALLKAAAEGDMTTIKSLRGERYIDLFDTDYDKRSALHLAACEGQVKVIKYLMKHNAAYNEAKDRCMNFTAVDDAKWHMKFAQKKKPDDYDRVIKYLITSTNTVASRKVSFREVIAQKLITAGEKGDLQELERIKELGTDMNLSNSTGCTALHAAAENQQLNAVKYLLDDCNVCPFVRWSGKRPIDLSNNEDVWKEIDKSMKSYFDPKTPIAKMQTDAESDISIVRLLNYASRGDLKGLRCLHASDPETIKKADYDQRTALHVAVCYNQEHIVEFLLKDCGLANEAEIAVDRWNNTPVMLAKERENKDIFKIFVKYCPNVIDTESDEYKTFELINAASKGDIRTLKKLYNSGFNMNKQDYDGRSALHLAAAEWKLDAVTYLIEKCGCNTHIIDRNGSSPDNEIEDNVNRDNFKTIVFKPSSSLWEDSDILGIAKSSDSKTKSIKTSIRQNWKKKFKRQKSKEPQTDTIAPYRKSLQLTDRSGVLFEAAAKGHIDTIKNCGISYFDVEDYNKNTPLHLAAANGHFVVVKYLIEEQHVSPFARENSMKTALDLVNDKIELLVNREATYSNINQRKRFTELRNYLDKVTEQQLSEQNVEEDPVFKRYNKDVQIFMLLQKSYKGDIISVRRYIKSDESNTLINKTDYDKRTALHIAVAEQHHHIVRYFLEDKNLKTIIITDLKDRWGNTPQMEAENNNFQDLVDIFKSCNC